MVGNFTAILANKYISLIGWQVLFQSFQNYGVWLAIFTIIIALAHKLMQFGWQFYSNLANKHISSIGWQVFLCWQSFVLKFLILWNFVGSSTVIWLANWCIFGWQDLCLVGNFHYNYDFGTQINAVWLAILQQFG